MSPTSTSETQLDWVVLEDGLAHYLRKRWISFAGNQFGACLLAWPAWYLAGSRATVGFLLLFSLLNLGIVWAKTQLSRQPASLRTYRRRSVGVMATAACQGAGLALGNILLHRLGGAEMLIYCVSVQAGIAAASLGVSAFHLPSLRSQLMLGLGAYLFSLGFVPSSMQVLVIGFGTTIALGFLLVMGGQQAQTLASAIRLQHRNDALLKELAKENTAANEARNVAQKAHAEKSHFFASASHDLRQPVHALNLYAALLRDPMSEAERTEILDRIESCVQSLDELFDNLLTVTRAESLEPGEIELSPVPLEGLMRTVVHQTLHQAEAQGTQLSYCSSRRWVLTDRLALERILSNLVSNAVAFSPGGRVLVGVRGRGDQAEIQVLDNGVGIAKAQQEMVFGEFYQANNPGRRRGRGFGLGLVIVDRLCRALNHPLEVRSVLGQGSCFSVRLPLSHQPSHSASGSSRPAPAWESPIHVLLVDDDAAVRDAMERLFAKWAIAATICASAQEALQKVREEQLQPQCLLVDQRLGEDCDGVELASRLNSLLPAPVPVAIISGETAGDWFERAQAQGFRVLFKPVKQIRLRAFLVASSRQPKAAVA